MTSKMAAFFKVQREQSALRSRLGEIRVMPAAQITEAITTEKAALEVRFTAGEKTFRESLDAVTTEQAQDGAGGDHAERRALIARSDFGRYMAAALSGAVLDGAEHELNAAVGAVAGHGGVCVPWEVLSSCRAPVEKRADAVSALPANGNETVEEAYVSRIFAGGSSEFLMARTTMLPAGSVSIPVVESGPSAEYFSASAVADADAAGVVFKTADPTRLQAAVVLRAADIQRSPGLILAIQNDLAQATADAVDKQIITQLFADLDDATESSAVVTYENFIAEISGAVDGKGASAISQVRVLLGVQTFALANSKISTNGDLSAVDYAAARAGGVHVSANMPAKTSTRQKGLLAKTGAPGSVASVFFGSGELINDPFSGSNRGERRLTLLSFNQILTLRKSAFKEASFKLS